MRFLLQILHPATSLTFNSLYEIPQGVVRLLYMGAQLSILFMRFPGKVVGAVTIVPNFQFSL